MRRPRPLHAAMQCGEFLISFFFMVVQFNSVSIDNKMASAYAPVFHDLDPNGVSKRHRMALYLAPCLVSDDNSINQKATP